MHRYHKTKIVATLAPSSSRPQAIERCSRQGVDVFRFNFTHGTHADHQARYDVVGALERESGQPICALIDLQGTKLRLSVFAGGRATLRAGERFRFDLVCAPSDEHRVQLLHPEVFSALKPGVELLLDD